MKCIGCIYADWERTANGRLHPNKQGRCTALDDFSVPPIPPAFYWSSFGNEPKPYGGQIERDRELKANCSWRKEEVAA